MTSPACRRPCTLPPRSSVTRREKTPGAAPQLLGISVHEHLAKGSLDRGNWNGRHSHRLPFIIHAFDGLHVLYNVIMTFAEIIFVCLFVAAIYRLLRPVQQRLERWILRRMNPTLRSPSPKRLASITRITKD